MFLHKGKRNMNNKKVKIPRYKQIENDLLDKINIGIYVVDSPLPTEAELSATYEVSRVTVRQALSNLVAKGFIYRNQGSGSFVAKHCAVQRTPLLKSFTEDMIEMGKIPSTIVNTFSITAAGQTISKILGIHPDSRIYYIERTRSADDIPIMFEKTYMSVDLHPTISIKVLESSKYKYADENGFYIDYGYQNIAPLFPPEYIANNLRIDTKTPILRIANTTFLKNGAIFDYTELYLNPELYQLNIIKKR